MAVSQEKISVYSLADLKNTTDDAVTTYLNSLSFKQSHTLSDVRLALGYTAFAICAATFYWDYKLGFESTKLYTAIAVAIYTLLNTALTYWVWGVERGTVYVGTAKSTGEKLQIRTETKKHVPRYYVTVTVSGGRAGKGKEVKFSKSFTEWFDAQGHFVTQPFQEMLASNIEVVGKADPKRVIAGKGKKEKVKPVDDGRSMDDKWSSLLAESSGEVVGGTTATPAKGTKRRAKKA